MDPGSLIVILILLALFAGALYFGYQKLVVDDVFDLTQEPTEPSTPTEPSAPPSSSDVPGVDSVKGRPLKPTTANKSIHYYAGGGDIVPKGMAKKRPVCVMRLPKPGELTTGRGIVRTRGALPTRTVVYLRL
jgi:hypothetical protein